MPMVRLSRLWLIVTVNDEKRTNPVESGPLRRVLFRATEKESLTYPSLQLRHLVAIKLIAGIVGADVDDRSHGILF